MYNPEIKGKWPWIIGGAIVLFIIIAISSSSSSPSTNQSSSAGNSNTSAGTNGSSEPTALNGSVQEGALGIYITNDETDTWTNCMVGLNGGEGWGSLNPPYATPYDLTFDPNTQLTVPYTQITKSDGTRFDYTTTAVTSIVVICDPTGGVDERYGMYQ